MFRALKSIIKDFNYCVVCTPLHTALRCKPPDQLCKKVSRALLLFPLVSFPVTSRRPPPPPPPPPAPITVPTTLASGTEEKAKDLL